MRSLPGFLLLLCCVPCCLAQTPAPPRQLGMRPGNGQFTGYDVQWFGRRFEIARAPYVRILDTAFYQKRRIKKVEVLAANRDSMVWWSVAFDPVSGAVQAEGQRTGNYFITIHEAKDSVAHTDTTVETWYQGSRLMRLDTVIATRFYYHAADTDMSFIRTRSVSYYAGALIDEQNDYYNTTFLHKAIADALVAKGSPASVRAKRSGSHVYLHKRLRTDFDSAALYLTRRSERDEDFRATVGAAAHYLPIEQLDKQHPFRSKYGDRPYTQCYTSGACFEEPRFYYETRMCGTTLEQRQREARETDYGFTSDSSGLYQAFYSERISWAEKNGKLYPEHSGREILYVLRYRYY